MGSSEDARGAGTQASLSDHIARKHELNLIDAQTFVELLWYWELFP